jgi:hypothetical protein
MGKFFTLGIGLGLGMVGALLFLRAGLPPAAAALVFWMVGGAVGLSLMQFAFLGEPVHQSVRAAQASPLRAFLLGLLVLEVPLLAANCFRLAGADGLGGLALVLFFGGFSLLLWPANVAYLIGQRLAPEESRPRQVAAGSFVSATSLLVPVLGWLWLFYLVTLTTGGFCLRGRNA